MKKGQKVTILSGRYKGQTATVIEPAVNDEGLKRLRVQLANGFIFSYLASSLTTTIFKAGKMEVQAEGQH